MRRASAPYLYSNFPRRPGAHAGGGLESRTTRACFEHASMPQNMHRVMLSSIPAYLEHASRPQNVHFDILRRTSSMLRGFEHASKPQNSRTLEETRLRRHWTKHFEETRLRRHWTKHFEGTGRRSHPRDHRSKKLDEETVRSDLLRCSLHRFNFAVDVYPRVHSSIILNASHTRRATMVHAHAYADAGSD